MNGKVLTPEELEKNKHYFHPNAFNPKVKTDAIINARRITPANQNVILYCLPNGTFQIEPNNG
jgi:hypothetical protein